MSNPLVSVILLNYKTTNHLKTALDCFRQQTYPNINIIVVDNGSEREIQDEIKVLEGIHCILNPVNKGWAGGNNIGIQYALERNADYILLANNDIVFDNTQLIEKFVEQAETLKDLNILVHGTQVYDFFNPNEKPRIGISFLSFKKGMNFNKIRIAFNTINQIPKQAHTVDSVLGCFMMIHKNVFQITPTFDEALFLYHEELEFSYRLWMSGIASAVHTNLSIFHKTAATTGRNSAKHLYYLNRNILYLFSKKIRNIGFSYKLRVYLNVFKMYFNIMFRKKIKKYNGSKLQLLRALTKAIFDGIFNLMGERY